MAKVKIPSGWLFLSLMIWAFATGAWMTALVAGVLCEAPQFLDSRWAFTTRHFERLADLTTVGFAVLAVYQFTTHGLYAIYGILREFPLVLLPLLLLQRYSTRGDIPPSALFISLRRAPERANAAIDLRPIFGLACVLAASANGLPVTTYAPLVAIALVILIVPNRRPAATPQLIAALMVAISLAGVLQVGIQRGQLKLGDALQGLFGDLNWAPVSADHTYTALGMLGRLKLSERIRLRIAATINVDVPLRLTEARYQIFNNGIWQNRNHTLTTVDPLPASTIWILAPQGNQSRELTITTERARELGAFALPAGAQRLASAQTLEVRSDPFGTLVAETQAGFVHYTVDYSPNNIASTPSTADDLAIPDGYRKLFEDIAAEANLKSLPPTQAVQQLEKFFADNFRYSLVQRGYSPWRTPLAEFLRHSRHGHCEYFATATTLLLREVGIPARYVIGYMTDEYSQFDHTYIARARHGHAWVEAFIEGHWRVVDTTPSRWLEDEAEQAPNWQSIVDAWAWLRLEVDRVQHGEVTFSYWWLALLPLLVGVLAWRLRHLSARKSAPSEQYITPTALTPLFTELARRGKHPLPGQTAREFLNKEWSAKGQSDLYAILALYYRARFSTVGISPAERSRLAALIATLLGHP